MISDGTAASAPRVGESCLTVLDWTGTVEVVEEPALDPEQPIVRFRVVDSNLYGATARKRVTGTLWDWVKPYVHPRLEAVTIDLHQPLDELRAFLPLVLPRRRRADDRAARLAARSPTSARHRRGLRVDLRFDVAEAADDARSARRRPSRRSAPRRSRRGTRPGSSGTPSSPSSPSRPPPTRRSTRSARRSSTC